MTKRLGFPALVNHQTTSVNYSVRLLFPDQTVGDEAPYALNLHVPGGGTAWHRVYLDPDDGRDEREMHVRYSGEPQLTEDGEVVARTEFVYLSPPILDLIRTVENPEFDEDDEG